METVGCEIDPAGLRRLIPGEPLPTDELGGPAVSRHRCPSSRFWRLCAADDARVDVAEACGVLLNRAVEIASLGAASGTTRAAS